MMSFLLYIEEKACIMKNITYLGGNMKNKKMIIYIDWIVLNVALPFIPFLIRVIISFFTNITINIFDSVELLLFNFYLCITLINNISKKNVITYLIKLVFIIIIVIDIILLVLIYSNIEKEFLCGAFSIIISILVTAFCFIYKNIEIMNKKK